MRIEFLQNNKLRYDDVKKPLPLSEDDMELPNENGNGQLIVYSKGYSQGFLDVVGTVFKRIVNSPLFNLTWMTTTSVALPVAEMSGSMILPVSSSLSGLGFGAGAVAYCYWNYDKLAYEASLIYTLSRSRLLGVDWWHEVNEQIVLGAIPLSNHRHHVAIQKMNVRAILTLLEDFESGSSGIFSVPVAPRQWEAMGIEHKQVHAKDFQPLTGKQIDESVAFIERCVREGKKVYIHCKAGVGRSATVVICYLLKIGCFNTVDETIAYLKKIRSHINLNAGQVQAIHDYERRVHLKVED